MISEAEVQLGAKIVIIISNSASYTTLFGQFSCEAVSVSSRLCSFFDRSISLNCALLYTIQYIMLIIHSFIHSGYLYRAPSRNLLRGALSPPTVKGKCLNKLAERRHVVLR